MKSGSSSCEIFLSTPSGWRATFVHIKFLRSFYSISIHALRVEGDPEVGHIVKTIGISIHALRVEGDPTPLELPSSSVCISIHALRVEGDSKNGQSFRLFLRKREKNLPL